MRFVSNLQPRFFRSLLLVFLGLGLVGVLIARFGSPGPVSSTASSRADVPILQGGPAGLTPTAGAPPATPTQAQPTATTVPTATPIPQPVKVREAAAPLTNAAAAVVIDEQSGTLLYANNEHAQRAPASITKIVTAIVALENAKLDDVVKVSYDAGELVDSTLMGLWPNDRITVRDLLFGLMLPSGNDAALALANHIAGSERKFAELMNGLIDRLDLRDSHFVNAHGLDARGHYTSAYDMAMVTRYGMRDAEFRQLAGARSFDVNLVRQQQPTAYTIYNLNQLLTRYPGADGVKIGYTENAGRTIVASATRDGHRVYAVVLGSANLWTDTPPLLDYAFKNFTWPETLPAAR